MPATAHGFSYIYMTRTDENVIIYRLGSLGDTIIALPCFHRIAKSFPTAKRILLTNMPVSSKAAPSLSILNGSGLVDESIAYPVGLRSPQELWSVAREIRALRARSMIYLMPARGLRAAFRDYLFFRLCGIRNIVGLPATADLQNNRIDPQSGDVERECERLVRTLAALGPIDLESESAWDLGLSDKERATAGEILAPLGERRFIAINMGGKAVQNDWGVSNWIELLKTLAVNVSDYGLLVVGALEDSQRAKEIAAHWPGLTVDACGKLSPRESAAALQAATLFAGHDSGPLHLAAASGIPCVGLLGNLNKPKKWHPPGKHHHIIHRIEGVMSITVSEVADAILKLLRR